MGPAPEPDSCFEGCISIRRCRKGIVARVNDSKWMSRSGLVTLPAKVDNLPFNL